NSSLLPKRRSRGGSRRTAAPHPWRGNPLIDRKEFGSLRDTLAGTCIGAMANQPFPSIAFLWPALAAASTSGMMSALAGQVANFGGTVPGPASPAPKWATSNRIALELPCMRLREFFADQRAKPTLICAPFALHRATIADFAPGHSLVRALRGAGLSHLCVTDWLSASPEMRYLSIDNYLADLHVAVDELGGNV